MQEMTVDWAPMPEPPEWVDVPGYRGLYRINEEGDIYALPRKVYHKRKGWYDVGDKVLKQSNGPGGYKVVTLYREGKRKTHTVHRLVAEAFICNPEELDTVDHLDNDKENNHVSNLIWMSRGENAIKGNAKTYKFVDPNGEVREIYNLHDFCKKNELVHQYMHLVLQGKKDEHKGWAKYE